LNYYGLRQGHDHHVLNLKIGILRLQFSPRRERANDIFAEQHHKVVAFGEDYQARWCSNPADNVRHGICVTVDRSDAGLQLGHDRPNKRSKRCLNH
jgi:hypothetical protein